jgi:hypothetical protein
MFALTPQQGWAGGDVGYELDTMKLEMADKQNSTQPTALEFKDRTWATPGVEESDYPLERSSKFDFHTSQRLRLVFKGEDEGPSWLDDVAWPRTRQLFHPKYDNRQVFCFGGIALQR